MKFTKIALAVAATLVAGQAFAAAVTQSDISAARTAGTLKESWFDNGNALAIPEFLGFEKLCDAGTIAIFDGASSGVIPGSTGDFPSYACKIGGVVTVLYNNNGGSALAYAPFLPTSNALSSFKTKALTRLVNLDSNASCTTSKGGVYTHVEIKTGTTVSTPVYGGCSTVANPTGSGILKPVGGFSDVESTLFGIKSLKGIGTETTTNFGQPFGIVVNPALYRALQTAQGITEPGGNTESNNNYDPALAPSITKSQYASIVQGNETSWQTGWSNLLGTSYASTPVYLVRRSADSGTQAASNAFFLGNPCNDGNSGSISAVTTGLAPNLWSTPNLDSFTVYESSSGGGVETTLTSLDNGTSITVDDGTGTGTTNVVTVPAGSFGIGVVSLTEDWRVKTASSNAGFRFIKIDGVSPEAGSSTGTVATTLFGTQNLYQATATVVNGQYPFFAESYYFTQANADAPSVALIKNVLKSLDDPNTCTLVPRGIALLNGITSCPSQAVQVTKNGNNCAVPTFVK